MITEAVLVLIGAGMFLLSSHPSHSALEVKKATKASHHGDVVVFTLCPRNSIMLVLQLELL